MRHTKHFSAYLASKAQAEQRVRAANKPSFRTIALRPPVLWGPGDPFSREIPRALLSGLLMFIDHGNYPFSTCHVDNLVEAIQCALKEGGGDARFSSQIAIHKPFVISSGPLLPCKACPSRKFVQCLIGWPQPPGN
ncbi:NAD-dependent epimerase/dehydratase family protein [Rouxiella aceris]|uniref:NAD-dependent epimerase/dehydratase family protein n=1 Tax=Rouxiella aceris TaxID=2703884 RepID=UPI0034D95392